MSVSSIATSAASPAPGGRFFVWLRNNFDIRSPFTSPRTFPLLFVFSFVATFLLVLSMFLLDAYKLDHDSGWKWICSRSAESCRQRASGMSCEKTYHSHFLGQKVNSTSNLAFLFFSIIVFGVGVGDSVVLSRDLASPSPPYHRLNTITTSPWTSFLLSTALAIMGVTSFFWHASVTVYGASLDVGSMYLLLLLLVGNAWSRVAILLFVRSLRLVRLRAARRGSPSPRPLLPSRRAMWKAAKGLSLAAAGAGAAGGTYVWYRHDEPGFIEDFVMAIILMVVMIGVGLLFIHPVNWIFDALERIGEKARPEIKFPSFSIPFRPPLTILSGIFVGGAYGLRQYDEHAYCNEERAKSMVQLHGVWHVFCAAAATFCWAALRNEDPIDVSSCCGDEEEASNIKDVEEQKLVEKASESALSIGHQL